MSLLEVEGLTTRFHGDAGTITAVDGISFALERGETLAIVGESGCGKSSAALSLMRLVPARRAPRGSTGATCSALGERDLLARARRRDRHGVPGADDEPQPGAHRSASRSPRSLHAHGSASRAQARARAIELLGLTGIPDPQRRVEAYPHTLSGGMRQRAMIAMAIACAPKLLIADEPTTALDVTVQAQILELLRDLQSRLAMGLLLITHDLGVVAELADRVAVMYAGRIVETAPADAPVRAAAASLHGGPACGLARRSRTARAR